MFYLLVLIVKSENKLIRKTNLFACDQFHIHYGIDQFCITYRKLITTIELQYYVNVIVSFNLNKSENLLIRFEKQSIISIQLFFNVMGWKDQAIIFKDLKVLSDFFCLNLKIDFCLANVNLQILIYMTIYKSLTLCFHHDSPWSNVRMITIKCWVENELEREPIALYCKIISKPACCWLFLVFFCLLLIGSDCRRLYLTHCGSFQVAYCSL